MVPLASLRVLHVVSTTRPRGAEVFAAELVQLLAERGIKQRVAALEAPGGAAIDFAVPTTVLASGFARRVHGLRREVGRWKPDVVQAHGGDSLKVCASAMVGRRSAIVYRNIGLVGAKARTRAGRVLYTVLMRRADRIVAVANVVARETVQLFGVPPARVVMIPNGIHPDRARPSHSRDATRSNLGVPGDSLLILSVAALTWEKDPMEHLAVARRVLDQLPSAFFAFAGDGPMRAAVESRIEGEESADRILVLGHRSDVGDLLGACDVFVFASRADGMEGMPATVIEAGMAGRPVVAYDVAGVGEVIVNGATGLLAPPGDTHALGDGLHRVLLDEEGRKRLGRRAREICMAQFDLRTLADDYLRVYEQVGRR